MKILIRADSSSSIGTGHIMRCLVLAKRDFSNDEVIFAVRDLDGNINQKIITQGFDIEILNSNDISELTSLIDRLNIDRLVIDHYDIGFEQELKIKKQTNCELFVLDDIYNRHYCDILLNHNIYAQKERYKGLVPRWCDIRCGKEFTLIRDEFYKAKESMNKKHFECQDRINVFVAMGGADTAKLNIPILEVLTSLDNLFIHIVTTSANRDLRRLKSYCNDKDNILLYINSNQIATLMSSVDFAIVTPSVILNEVFFMELPFIAIATAINQKEMLSYLTKRRYLVMKKFNRNTLYQLVKELCNG